MSKEHFKPLTDKEKEFFSKYVDYFIYHLKPPTREELASFMGISPQLCQYYLDALVKKGYLVKVIRKEEKLKPKLWRRRK